MKNESVLPFVPKTGTVGVIGPHADAAWLQFPTYAYPSWRDAVKAVDLGEAMNMVGAETPQTAWNKAIFTADDSHTFAREQYGARPLHEEIAEFAGTVLTEQGSTLTTDLGPRALARAVEVAERSDVVVLALGGASLWFNGERTEGEGSDSADISLPAAQTRLAEAVAATGKPYVVVLFQGRPYALPEAVRDAAAIVVAPYGGPFGTRSVAEVLFGAVDPSGKLPYSIPRHSGQIPVYHHQKAGTGYRNPLPPGTAQLYLDMPGTPLYTFGHGLGYTDFALGDLDCDRRTGTAGTTRIATTVTNTGGRAGAAVVQLHVRVNTSGVTRPAQQLAGFCRVPPAPGESRRVTFEVAAAQLAYTTSAREFAVEPAPVEFFLGFDADDRRVEGSFELVGEARVLAGADRAFLSRAVTEPV
ncbi:glycoside hydrolase family 3 C-terminal domain-containing protein [Streptomyces sp. JW3]|uniref:glycoside hydrolase family 3 C-terminal domain-containing protein n=1 Tax=Streptomyces sp. JW3 TaxID=3456955 RepID=UPI003FA4B946